MIFPLCYTLKCTNDCFDRNCFFVPACRSIFVVKIVSRYIFMTVFGEMCIDQMVHNISTYIPTPATVYSFVTVAKIFIEISSTSCLYCLPFHLSSSHYSINEFMPLFPKLNLQPNKFRSWMKWCLHSSLKIHVVPRGVHISSSDIFEHANFR